MAGAWDWVAARQRVTHCVNIGWLLAIGAIVGCAPTPAAQPAPRTPEVASPQLVVPPVETPNTEELISAPPAPAFHRPLGSPRAGNVGFCLRSRMCEWEGLCSARGEDLCIAADDADCEDSKACMGGRCSARDGVCVAANDEDCRESVACSSYGRCNFDGADACKAISEEDCRASARCTRLGQCRVVGDVCGK